MSTQDDDPGAVGWLGLLTLVLGLVALAGFLVVQFGGDGSRYSLAFASAHDGCSEKTLYFDEKTGAQLDCQGQVIDRSDKLPFDTSERSEAAKLAKELVADGKVDDADRTRMDALAEDIADRNRESEQPRHPEARFWMKAGGLLALVCLAATIIAAIRAARRVDDET